VTQRCRYGKPKPVTKSGYLFVYVSYVRDKEAEDGGKPVFFDNLTVQHYTGPLVEETAYYPFGLKMAGICCRAYGRIGSRKLYNGNELQEKEFSDGSGLDFYDFNARSYDQQLGRFMQVDPLAEEEGQESCTPYHFTYNNPVRFEDADGKIPIPAIIGVAVWAWRAYRVYRSVQTLRSLVNNTKSGATTNHLPGSVSIPGSSTAGMGGKSVVLLRVVKKGPKDLVAEAKEAQAKEAAAKARAANRAQQSKEGAEKEGQSNETVKGEHKSGTMSKANKQKHQKANARRAREQAAAKRE
jgi:RHS repeat-associated protein